MGQGYVGQSLAIAAANAGHIVLGYDVNPDLINQLVDGKSYVPGVNSNVLFELQKNGNFTPTTNAQLISNSEIVIIAVPTPLDVNRQPDLSFVFSACKVIVENCHSGTLIINESTSYPGTLRNIIVPTVEKAEKKEFMFASAPERVDPGNSNWNISNTPRVIAGLSAEATSKAIQFYSTFCSSLYQVSSPEIAEASKLFENTFRQINISLVNEFSIMSRALGFSAHEAIKAASTKPFGFMPFFPSIGVGGHCIPVDPIYLSHIAESVGIEPKFIKLANSTNLNRPSVVARQINNFIQGGLSGKRIQIAGIAYKPGVPDMRESPVLYMIKELEKLGGEVIWCDPLVSEYNGEKSTPLTLDIDLGLIITPHEEFDFSIWKNSKIQVLDLSPNLINFGWPKFL
ncbi:MAG: nucleotide sugar dehydrogenase [Actinomycetota bacterium]|nr:nucleotide sugar dehydrogenase [Actinomycetota bacterium]